MELCTIGREIYPGYKMPLCHLSGEEVTFDVGYQTSYRLIWVEQGNGILRNDNRYFILSVPALLCLNELEAPLLDADSSVIAQAIVFHPNIINSSLTFTNVREGGNGLRLTDQQDRDNLQPFYHRDAVFFGQIPLDPGMTQKVGRLFKSISEELNAQRDGNWPCRSRSYLIELIILTQRLFEQPSLLPAIELDELYPEIGSILNYLHLNYEQKITLRELTQTFHLNRTTLEERFQQATGESVMSYLRKLRMVIACSLLRDTELKVGEIMERVGILDFANFSRAFQKFAGHTPSEYRRLFWGFRY